MWMYWLDVEKKKDLTVQDDDALDGEEQQDHIRIKKELDFFSRCSWFSGGTKCKTGIFPSG